MQRGDKLRRHGVCLVDDRFDFGLQFLDFLAHPPFRHRQVKRVFRFLARQIRLIHRVQPLLLRQLRVEFALLRVSLRLNLRQFQRQPFGGLRHLQIEQQLLRVGVGLRDLLADRLFLLMHVQITLLCRQFERLLDGGMLRLHEQVGNRLVANLHVQHFHVVNPHAVFLEHETGTLAALAGRADNRVADNLDRVRIKCFDAVPFNGVSQHRTGVVGQKFHVIFDIEPFFRLAFEIDAIRDAHLHRAKIAGFRVNHVRHLVMQHAQIHRFQQRLVAFRRAGRKFHQFQNLVIFQQIRHGADDDLALAGFADD